jgi:hypothetical protein
MPKYYGLCIVPDRLKVIAVSGNRCRNGKTIFAGDHDWLDEDQERVNCLNTEPDGDWITVHSEKAS